VFQRRCPFPREPSLQLGLKDMVRPPRKSVFRYGIRSVLLCDGYHRLLSMRKFQERRHPSGKAGQDWGAPCHPLNFYYCHSCGGWHYACCPTQEGHLPLTSQYYYLRVFLKISPGSTASDTRIHLNFWEQNEPLGVALVVGLRNLVSWQGHSDLYSGSLEGC
jgi:hypothetical protein